MFALGTGSQPGDVLKSVIPAKAGIQDTLEIPWIPTCAGMTCRAAVGRSGVPKPFSVSFMEECTVCGRMASSAKRLMGMMLVGNLVIGLLVFGNVAMAEERSLGDLTGPWQLFVDDYLVASKTGVLRQYHPFTKYAGNPVMTADKPWEGENIYVYGTALPGATGTGYRLWYHALPGDVKYRLCYAESADGVHWEKPNLGIVEYSGSKDNNIFIARSGSDHIPSILHTPWDAGRPYKMLNFDGGATPGFFASYSSDGIHWTDVANNPVVTGGDVGNFMWDPLTSRFLGYVKLNSYVRELKRRAVGFSATADFETWPRARLILSPDDVDDRWVPAGTVQRTHFYGMGPFAYQTMYLGLLWIFRATDPEGYYDGPIYVELVSSRDGQNWTREEGGRPPILELGPPGSWDDGMVLTTQHPLLEGDTLKLYYGGIDDTHAAPSGVWHSAIGLATLRKDGFVSLDAHLAWGTVTTRNLRGAGGPLHVNCDASRGAVAVEVLDAKGGVIPGYGQDDCNAVRADGVDQIVTWKSHSELPSGNGPIALRFAAFNASLYSFMAGESVRVDDPATMRMH